MTLKNLRTDLRLVDPDAFYAELISATSELDDDKAQLVHSKLLLLLANHIGDIAVLREALAAAREDVV